MNQDYNNNQSNLNNYDNTSNVNNEVNNMVGDQNDVNDNNNNMVNTISNNVINNNDVNTLNDTNNMQNSINNAVKQKTNKNAILSVTFSIVSMFIFWWLSLVAISLGIMALKEIKVKNEKGKVLAIIGIVIGMIGSVIYWSSR